MNKLLKVTLITAIMATSGMCMSGMERTITINSNTYIPQNLLVSNGDVSILKSQGQTGDVRWFGNTIVKNHGKLVNEGVIVYQSALPGIKSYMSIENHGSFINKKTFSLWAGSVIEIKNAIFDGGNDFKVVRGSVVNVRDNGIFTMGGKTLEIDSSPNADVLGQINIFEGGTLDFGKVEDMSGFQTRGADNKYSFISMQDGSSIILPKATFSQQQKITTDNNFIINIQNIDKSRPVEIKYFLETENVVGCNGLNSDVLGCDYKKTLKKSNSDMQVLLFAGDGGKYVTYKVLEDKNTGIKFVGDIDNIKLTPIRSCSLSIKPCNGKSIKLLESSDFGC